MGEETAQTERGKAGRGGWGELQRAIKPSFSIIHFKNQYDPNVATQKVRESSCEQKEQPDRVSCDLFLF